MTRRKTPRTIAPAKPIVLPSHAAGPEMVHIFEADDVQAINASLAARRPLLLRGEPGTGKSQMALAAACALGRAFVAFVVGSRTEAQDLLWSFDAVARLATAQTIQALKSERSSRDAVETDLAVANFVSPGPLWWAFDWVSAEEQTRLCRGLVPMRVPNTDPANGTVVLIDEIDKADSDVPNGLLEALGSASFTPQGRSVPVTVVGAPPLVIVTTNEERALPDAFVRRCLVHHLRLPTDPVRLAELLVSRARAHFPRATDEVLGAAAAMLVADRDTALAEHLRPIPGQAEYLDLVRAVLELAPDDPQDQLGFLERIGKFALRKQAERAG